jgi:hypothetical protein
MTPTYDERLRRVLMDEATRLIAPRWTTNRLHTMAAGLRVMAQYAEADELAAFVAKLKAEAPDA